MEGLPEQLPRVVLTLVTMILSLTVHEYAHARTAWALGDDTAASHGRLTLNPMSHVDALGTLLLPALASWYGGIPFIGWARPVPFNPVRFTRRLTMRTGTALVAVAGPLSNVLLAVACAVGLRFLPHFHGPWVGAAGTMLFTMVHLNVGLAIFNLLPIPPLDGSRLLPRRLDGLAHAVGKFSFFFFLLILMTPAGAYLGSAVGAATALLFGAVGLS
ncbi:MAG: site-2 protease family protein [Deltaproteobacteria bacterium]|nr:site-2 protease family protein [Deltaproteobacteria bacterium]